MIYLQQYKSFHVNVTTIVRGVSKMTSGSVKSANMKKLKERERREEAKTIREYRYLLAIKSTGGETAERTGGRSTAA